jgi:hypothetical protein
MVPGQRSDGNRGMTRLNPFDVFEDGLLVLLLDLLSDGMAWRRCDEDRVLERLLLLGRLSA